MLNHVVAAIIVVFALISGELFISILHNMQDEKNMANESLVSSQNEYNIWIPSNLDEKMIKSIYTSYDEEKMGVNFKITMFSEEIYEDTLINAGITNKLPDMFYIKNKQCLEQLVEIGGIMDLSEYVATKRLDRNFMKGTLEDFMINRRIYGLPIMGEENVLYYNEDIFEACNMTYPKTYKEFIEVINQFKQIRVIPLSVGGASYESVKCYFQMLVENYGNIEEAASALEELIKLEPFERKYEGIEEGDALSTFIRGESAMFIGTSTQASLLEGNRARKKNFKVTACPIGDKSINFGNYTYGFVLKSGSSFNREEVRDFYEKFSRDFSWEMTVFRGKGLPVYKNQKMEKTRFTLLNSCSEIMKESSKEGMWKYLIESITKERLNEIYKEQIMGLFQGKIDSKTFLSTLGL